MYSAQNDYENVACLVTRKSGAEHIYTSVADFGSSSYLLFNHCKPNKKSNTQTLYFYCDLKMQKYPTKRDSKVFDLRVGHLVFCHLFVIVF